MEEKEIINKIKEMKKGDIVKYYTGHFGNAKNIDSALHKFIMSLVYTPYRHITINKKIREDLIDCDYICYQSLVSRNSVLSVFDYFIKKVK